MSSGSNCGGEGLGFGQGQLLHRLFHRNTPCECTPVCSCPCPCEGGPSCDGGPPLESPGVPPGVSPGLPPGVSPGLPPVGTEPPIAPSPRPFPPQAQPSPAGPVSKVRAADQGK
jgi:hypothetical protein